MSTPNPQASNSPASSTPAAAAPPVATPPAANPVTTQAPAAAAPSTPVPAVTRDDVAAMLRDVLGPVARQINELGDLKADRKRHAAEQAMLSNRDQILEKHFQKVPPSVVKRLPMTDDLMTLTNSANALFVEYEKELEWMIKSKPGGDAKWARIKAILDAPQLAPASTGTPPSPQLDTSKLTPEMLINQGLRERAKSHPSSDKFSFSELIQGNI